MRQLLELLNQGYDVDQPPAGTEDALGGLKQLIWRPVRAASSGTMEAQRQFNANLVRLLNALSQRLELERGLLAKEQGGTPFLVEELEAQAERTAGRLGELEERLGKLESRVLAYLEAAGRPEGAGERSAEEQPLPADYAGLFRDSAFQDRFRGGEELIKERLTPYLAHFTGCNQVVDLGCGRGEFLGLLKEAEIPACGVEGDPARVRRLEDAGYRAVLGDAIKHLEGLAPGEADGIFAAQLVEHLEPAGLLALLQQARRVLPPGGKILLESVNPVSLYSLVQNYFRDPSHRQPLHPETLQFLVQLHGFGSVEIIYGSPIPAEHRLQGLPGHPQLRGEAALETLAADLERIDRLLFGPQDFAVAAIRRTEAD
jgi:O-antigen chain-terminating methyltransferase